MKFSELTFLLCSCIIVSISPVRADDYAEDCDNENLPIQQQFDACLHSIKKLKGGTPNDVASGNTRIVGLFSGCRQGVRYQLLNGREMECHTTLTHTSSSPDVKIIDDVNVIIDGEKYKVIIY